MCRADPAVGIREPGRPMEIHGPGRPTGATRGPGRSDLHRRTVEWRMIGREVRIVDEIKLERRTKSRVKE